MLSSQSLDPWFHLRPVLLGSRPGPLPVGESSHTGLVTVPSPSLCPHDPAPLIFLLLGGLPPPWEFMSGTPKLDPPLSPKL